MVQTPVSLEQAHSGHIGAHGHLPARPGKIKTPLLVCSLFRLPPSCLHQLDQPFPGACVLFRQHVLNENRCCHANGRQPSPLAKGTTRVGTCGGDTMVAGAAFLSTGLTGR